MDIKRKQHLSIYYWIKDQLPVFVNTVYSFPARTNAPDQKLVLPTVSITAKPTKGYPLELGGLEHDLRFWSIDVFAKNEIQRDDFSYLIYSNIEAGIDVYNYDEGFPPSISPTKLGSLIVEGREINQVDIIPELVQDLYWRTNITFITKYTEV